VAVNANYTWSHCIGAFTDRRPVSFYIDPVSRDNGNCNSDRRHIFNLTAVAETPQFANSTLRKLATGWRLSGIYRKSAGSPLNLTAGSDRALTDITDNPQRANQVLGNVYGDRSAGPMSQYLNVDAVQLPALGTYGNMGRNSVTGPGTWQFDASLSRTFQLGETQRLEVRAEAYHVTNSFRPGNPSTGRNNAATFGVIRTALDPRIMQFALKYAF
jgi:hypothetical protein